MKSNKKEKQPAKTNYGKTIISNAAAVVLLLFLLDSLVSKNVGYHWMWNTLLKQNLESIQQYKHLTTAQKHESRQGFFFTYLNFINTHTPEDAVILLPPDSIIQQVDGLNKLGDRRKTTYFIYPRRAVYEKYRHNYDSTYWNKITHVAIVNYYGYDKLNYQVNDKQQFSILPAKQVHQ